MIFSKRNFYAAACFSAALLCGNALYADDATQKVEAQPVKEALAEQAPTKADVPAEKVAQAAPLAVPVPAAAPADSKPAPDPLEAEVKALGEEIEKLQKERSKIEAELGLAQSQREKELLPMRLEKMRLDAERAQRAAQFSAKLAEIDEERAKLDREFALANARVSAALRAKQLIVSELEADSRDLQVQMAALNAEYSAPVALANKKQELAKVAVAQPKYLKEPFVDGTLYISDRRIDFNGAVTPDSARRACELINFYDNQSSEYPIFIVIDNSPGGSVLAGYQIQKAMQSARAPVYVVVKGMAASMAAVLATTAERSYCFANTRILHHQISSVFERSNLTVLREGVAHSEEVYKIFIGPVAKKLGVSIEEFTKQMYEHNSQGDWEVFGTEAVERKWVDFLVDRVEETSFVALESPQQATPQRMVIPTGVVEKTDSTGQSYAELPMLENPFDCWWLSDKTGYYRAR